MIYPVEVRDDGEGECTCPDFPNERTCKHVGAAALAADALSMREARALDGRLSSLRAALEGEDRAALIHLLMDLARSLPGAMALLAGEEDEEAF